MFNKIRDFSIEQTYMHIVEKPVTKMAETVDDEIAATIGQPRPHRKI